MMDSTLIVDMLRALHGFRYPNDPTPTTYTEAADLIERLEARVAYLTAELDRCGAEATREDLMDSNDSLDADLENGFAVALSEMVRRGLDIGSEYGLLPDEVADEAAKIILASPEMRSIRTLVHAVGDTPSVADGDEVDDAYNGLLPSVWRWSC